MLMGRIEGIRSGGLVQARDASRTPPVSAEGGGLWHRQETGENVSLAWKRRWYSRADDMSVEDVPQSTCGGFIIVDILRTR